jgi:RecB family exonuclease
VTAVAGTEGEANQPSRFLAELGAPVRELAGRPRRPLSLAALIGELRQVGTDPEATPGLREQAALRLARLADACDADGRPLAVAARPDRWWGMRKLSDAADPVIAPDAPIQLSGSQLATVLACPRQWFLARKAQGESVRNPAATFGSVVHVLAEYGARPDTDLAGLAGHLDTVWDQLDFDANWLSAAERLEAEAAVERFVAWQQARGEQRLLGTEVEFGCNLPVGGERVRLTGTADRVERDPDGRIRIVDFKTGRAAPSASDVAVQDQLGVYQLAVAEGALSRVAGDGVRPAGAELVYLRLSDGNETYPRVFHQASLDDVPFPAGRGPAGSGQSMAGADDRRTWVHARLAEAAEVIRQERFDARIGPACRYCRFRDSCPAQASGGQVVR